MNYKISFITICHNRLAHLKMTLRQNIIDNLDYTNVEFVVVDYNCKQSTHKWVSENLSDFIKAGKLKSYQIKNNKGFDRSHSRNVGFLLSDGDIVCNVDADNFCGNGFADYINTVFSNNPKTFMACGRGTPGAKDLLGRIAVRKQDFIAIKGYDESFQNYGFEDIDFKNRLRKLGRKEFAIQDVRFLRYLSHSDDLRYTYKGDIESILTMLVRFENIGRSTIFIIWHNGKLEKIDLVRTDLYEKASLAQTEFTEHEYALGPTGITHGLWKKDILGLRISIANQTTIISNIHKRYFDEISKSHVWQVPDEQTIPILKFREEIPNREKMKANLNRDLKDINPHGFGYVEGLTIS